MSFPKKVFFKTHKMRFGTSFPKHNF